MRTIALPISLSMAAAVVGALSFAQAATPTKLTAQELEKVRAEVKLVFGVLPDRMSGSEADTPARIELGRKLFFETRLSVNQSQSCNTCHRVDENLGGVDNEPTSEGAFNKRGDRNAPTVLNAGYHFAQFWDGRAPNLKEQAKGPVLNPVEMAMPAEAEVVKRLKSDKDYPKLFAAAFPGAAETITYDNMAEAIAAFERTLRTNDRFDDFQRGDNRALSDKEQVGLKTFLETGCTTCHNKPTIGAQTYQKMGLVQAYEDTRDEGRFKVTNDEDDKFKFKVPSLRNVALTAPYFHNGSMAKLPDTVKKMGALQLGKDLPADEVDILVAFLNTLTDKQRGKR